MKIIIRLLGFGDADDCPCDEAMRTIVAVGKTVDDAVFDIEAWTVDFETLEDLQEFINRYTSVVMFTTDFNLLCIVVPVMGSSNNDPDVDSYSADNVEPEWLRKLDDPKFNPEDETK